MERKAIKFFAAFFFAGKFPILPLRKFLSSSPCKMIDFIVDFLNIDLILNFEQVIRRLESSKSILTNLKWFKEAA